MLTFLYIVVIYCCYYNFSMFNRAL